MRKYEQKGYDMRFWMGWLLALAWFMPAYAGDRIETGPVPAWVRPVALPATPPKGKGSVTYLLADEQYRLEPGMVRSYAETVFRIESAEGLSSGNISLSWQPETQTLTVHRVTIRRGEQQIDVLGSGRTFEVLRREANLESAMLDGMLTANLQPEDLQVGDIITLATTVTSSDPTYRGHVEESANAIYGMPIGRHHVSAEWPASLPIRLRQTEGLPTLSPRRAGNMMRIELTTDALQPPLLPDGAPPRFHRPRVIEMSDFRDWSDLAALFAPLYDKATAIPADSPLQAEIARIRAAHADPAKRAEAALALVQGQVRYVALLMGTGNFVPADATATWNRRFGDCKAKSALLVAMLRALDIPADPVIVNTSGNDGLDARLPMVGWFDHVIVRATIGGRAYWLDGTRTGDLRLDQIRTPDMDWGLPLVKGAGLVRMAPEPLDQPAFETLLRIDASRGMTLAAPVHAEAIFRGDGAYEMHVSAADLTAEARDRAVRDYWKRRYAFVEVTSASGAYDPDRREHRLVMDGKAKLDWQGGVYWLVDSQLGDRKADFERDPGENRDAPFDVTYPYFRRSTETILLPPGVVPDDAAVAVTAAGVEYRRSSRLTGNVFTVEASSRSLATEFPASEAASAQKALRALADRYIAVRAGEDYASTAEEIREKLSQQPQTTDEWRERAQLLIRQRDYPGAIAALDRLLAASPRDIGALVTRGLARMQQENHAAADKDFRAAEAIDPDAPTLASAQARLAEIQDRFQDAARYYDRAIKASPDDAQLLGARALVLFRLGDHPGALRDSAQAIKAFPDWRGMYMLRAGIFNDLGRADEAAAQAAALAAANPTDEKALGAVVAIYRELDRNEDALRAIDRLIALKPSASVYIDRHYLRRWGDIAGRRADVEAALRLDPRNVDALRAEATLRQRDRDMAGAVATLTTALAIKPDNSDLLATRGQAQFLMGRPREAARDFAAARRAARTSDDFNAVCWSGALAGMDLPAALADCDRSIALDKDNYEPLDTRGFILVKLGRHDEAIGFYDRALAINPALSESLYGRSLAWTHKGDPDKARADRNAALAIDPDIEDAFRFYGLPAPVVVADNRPDRAPARTPAADEPAGRPLDGFTRRGMYLLGDMDFDGALAAFEAAIKKDGSNARALAGRGFVMAWRDDMAAATRDIHAAAVMEPDDGYVLRTRGWLAQKQRRYAEALRFYTRVLQQQPDDHTAYGWRAEVYRAVGDDKAALRDSDMATKLRPTWADMYFLRARIYLKADQPAKAFAEARAAVAASPQNSFAHYQAAIIFNEGGRPDDAMKAVNRAIEIEPRADLFMARRLMRAEGDKAGQRQDVDAALRFDPAHRGALREKALQQEEDDDVTGAVATLSLALRSDPDSSELLTLRGQLLATLKRDDEAIRDFAAARANAKEPEDLNLLCWNHAITDLDLPVALRDCQAALAKAPDEQMSLRSQGLVQLKLGQIDDAITSYGRALAIEPGNAYTLYARAEAWKRKGDAANAAKDRAAATKIDPNIVENARKMGLAM